MRAWQVTKRGEPHDAIGIADVPVPEPGAGEVRIRVEAAALGLPDVMMCRGSYAFEPALPFTPGQEVSGVVTAVGAGAQTRLGSRVMAVTSFFRGHGGFAEEALALDVATHPAPAEMSWRDAAGFVIPYHTAWIGLVTRGRIAPGETLLVLGAAGGSGSAAIALGKARGARVIAVAGGAEKGAFCRERGADVVIDHREASVRDDGLAAAVRDATGGRGADVVYDPVGGEMFDVATRCLANEGRLLAIGYASGSWCDASTAALVQRNASVVGVYVGAYTKPHLSEVHEQLLGHWRRGALPAAVGDAIPFEGIGAALGEIAARRATGKLVARVGTGAVDR